MPAEPRLSRAVIVVAAMSLTAAAGLLFLLAGPLRGDAALPATAMTAPGPGAAEPPARRLGAEEAPPPPQEKPPTQDPSTLEVKQPVPGRPIKAPSFAGKPMQPVLPVLDEVRSGLLPTIERCVVGSRDEETPPTDPFRVRLELFIENAEARFAFERVEPQNGREFPVLGACLSERLAAMRVQLRAVPPADYARDGVFNLPWVATVSVEN
jgi:hypothetical protein